MVEHDSEVLRLKKILDENSTSKELVTLSKLISTSFEGRVEARELCYKCLTKDPDNKRTRLELARLYYLDGYMPFCVAELTELSKRVKTRALDRLLAAFGLVANESNENRITLAEQKSENPSEQAGDVTDSTSEILAELDLDADVLELYEDVTGKTKDN